MSGRSDGFVERSWLGILFGILGLDERFPRFRKIKDFSKQKTEGMRRKLSSRRFGSHVLFAKGL